MFLLTGIVMALLYGICYIITAIDVNTQSNRERDMSEYDLQYIQDTESIWLNSARCPIEKKGNTYICTAYKNYMCEGKWLRLSPHYMKPFPVHYGYDETHHRYGIIDSYGILIFDKLDIDKWIREKDTCMKWIPHVKYYGENKHYNDYYECSMCGHRIAHKSTGALYCPECHRTNRER